MDAFTKKRRLNQLMLDGLQGSEHPVAFFCECDRDDCYQAAWLTADDYRLSEAQSGWRALSQIHWEHPSHDEVGAALAMTG